MVMRAARAARHRWVATVMAGAGCLLGAVPATAVQTTEVHCPADDLQQKINDAAPGSTLQVSGTCVGNFIINKNLNLIGVRNAVLDGGGTGAPVTVDYGGFHVQLTTLTITNGIGNGTNGGGISNLGGTLTVIRSTVRNNSVSNNGGGINNDNGGTLTLDHTTVRDNSAGNAAGGIISNGTLKLMSSTVSGNSASFVGGIYNYGGTLTLNSSTVSNNTATASDTGGIFNYTGSTLTLNSSTVSNNTATTDGGGIYNIGTATLDRSTVRGNTAGNTGGGIRNDGSGSMSLTRSTVVRNTANGGPNSGGGIFNTTGSTVSLDGSRVRFNVPDNCAPEGTITGCTG
ncbi:hypothetical protein ABZ865_41405 [Streptomyces sp. NPDC047085]|uniref:hypothetical protein n=1 Tax=Streptomyces sp. NPDC047085 TaxID=3155140 RepID=UPI0033F11025